MAEAVLAYETKLLSVDVRNDGIADGAIENRIQDRARTYVLRERNSLSDTEFRALVDRVDGLLKEQDINILSLDMRLAEAKQAVRRQTREKLAMPEMRFSDIQNSGDLSRYIDQSGDQAMQALEKTLGLDAMWKVFALTGARTSVELLKAFTDILKFGESIADGLDRKDQHGWERTLEIAKWLGVDGLRALGLAGWAGMLGKTLSKAKIPESWVQLWEGGGASVSNLPPGVKLGEVLKGQRGAVGDLSKKRVAEDIKPVSKAEIVDPLALTQILEKTPKEFGGYMNFELAKLRDPAQNFEHLFRGIGPREAPDLMEMVNRNANRWLKDMLWNTNNLVKYLEQYPDRARLRSWREIQKYDTTMAIELNKLKNSIKAFEKEKGLIVNSNNTNKLVDLIQRMHVIPN